MYVRYSNNRYFDLLDAVVYARCSSRDTVILPLFLFNKTYVDHYHLNGISGCLEISRIVKDTEIYCL